MSAAVANLIRWNSSVEYQAFCRVYRIGQKRETRLFKCIMTSDPECVEDRMLKIKKEKERVTDNLVPNYSGNDDLRLLGLSRPELDQVVIEEDEGEEDGDYDPANPDFDNDSGSAYGDE